MNYVYSLLLTLVILSIIVSWFIWPLFFVICACLAFFGMIWCLVHQSYFA